MKTRLIGMIVMVLAGLPTAGVLTAGAAGDELRHPSARKAVARAEQETRKAEQVYRQELLRIQRTLISELEQAKADAMQRQLLEEANAIQAAIDAARAELDRLEGKPVVERFEVDSAKDWQDSGVYVNAGEAVRITAVGRWTASTSEPARFTFGPDGNGKGLYHLEAKIGNGDAIAVGSRYVISPGQEGPLYFRMRDGRFDDNAGKLQVVIEKRWPQSLSVHR